MALIPQDASHDVQQTIQQLNDELAEMRARIAQVAVSLGERDPNLVTKYELERALSKPKHLDFRDVFRAAGPAHSIGYVPSNGITMSGAMPEGHERVLREDAAWRMPSVQGPYTIADDDPHDKHTLNGSLHVAGALASSRLLTGPTDIFGDVLINGTTLFGTKGLPHGGFYANELSWTQASAAQNTWYTITSASINDSASGLHQVTHDGNGELTVTYGGMYLLVYAVSFWSSAANHAIQTAPEINASVPYTDGVAHTQTTAVNAGTSHSSQAILKLAPGATVEIAIRTTTTGSPTLTVDHVNAVLVHIGGEI